MKRRAEVERDMQRERRKAERWLRRHGGDITEGSRSAMFSGRDRVASGSSAQHASIVSIDQHGTVDEWEQAMVESGEWYLPLVGQRQELTADEEERRSRIEYVLQFLLPVHVELLRMRHVERMTLENMAEEFSCSHPNVIKRLKVAEQNFRRAYGQHYEDEEAVRG